MSAPTLDKATRDAFEAMLRFVRPVECLYPTPGDLAKAVDPRTIQTPALDLIDRALVDVADGRCKRLIITLAPQEGKALALDTPIATPAGWTTMADIQPGDMVFDRHGQPCTVTWTSPVWHDRPCFTVHAGDGEAIVADAAHEWVVRLDRRRPEKIVETAAMVRRRSKNPQIIGSEKGIVLPDIDLPVDPYTLGVWLGDGHTTSAALTCHPNDGHILERVRAGGWPVRKVAGKYKWSLAERGSYRSRFRAALTEIGVWGNKHVPDSYMRGSREQRFALLQGLVDTDGYVDPRGQVEFCSMSERLACDVRDLVFSLGAKATVHTGRASLAGKDCGTKYRVRFFLAGAASLPRKAERCKDSSVATVRYVWATATASVPVRCIEVDSPDHTYLAGRTLLPTHNSTRVTRRNPLWLLQRNRDLRIAVASYEHNIARRWGRAIRNDIAENPHLGLTVRSDMSAAHEWQLSGHEGGVYCVGIGGALTGRPVDYLLIDDPVKGPREAESQTYRDAAWDWWESVGSTRLAPGAPVVLIMTRWHEDDLAGRMLRNEPDVWTLLNIPAQADHRPEQGETDPLGRQPGEYLRSARGRTVEQWETIRTQRGSRVWNALYQGRPSPGVGLILQRHWWRYYEQPQWTEDDGARHPVGMDEVVQSWDMAFKDTSGADYVVGQVWGRRGETAYLLDQVRGRWSFVETCTRLKMLSARWPAAHAKLVEDKANGTAVISQLRNTVGGLIPVEPEGSKLARASAVSPFVESGNVYLPDPALAPWVDDLVEECAAFPTGSHDDQVDTLSQGLNRLLVRRTRPGVRWL